jgi:hypothetical protein
MNAESLVHERGKVAIAAHKDQFTREEKEALRNSADLVQAGNYFLLLIDEEPSDYEEELVDVTTFEDEEPVHVPTQVAPGAEPTMKDLRGLTVDRLKELADSEDVDLTGLKLKDDILGRMAAHFGLDPAS